MASYLVDAFVPGLVLEVDVVRGERVRSSCGWGMLREVRASYAAGIEVVPWIMVQMVCVGEGEGGGRGVSLGSIHGNGWVGGSAGRFATRLGIDGREYLLKSIVCVDMFFLIHGVASFLAGARPEAS